MYRLLAATTLLFCFSPLIPHNAKADNDSAMWDRIQRLEDDSHNLYRTIQRLEDRISRLEIGCPQAGRGPDRHPEARGPRPIVTCSIEVIGTFPPHSYNATKYTREEAVQEVLRLCMQKEQDIFCTIDYITCTGDRRW